MKESFSNIVIRLVLVFLTLCKLSMQIIRRKVEEMSQFDKVFGYFT